MPHTPTADTTSMAQTHHTIPPKRHSQRAASTTARLLAAAGAVVLFFGVASIIEPTHTPAAAIHGNQSTRSAGNLAHTPEPGKAGLLGTLIGAAFTVEIFAATPEPLYSVYDAAGNRLIERATKDEIYRIDPSLDLSTMLGPAVGMVDHHDH